MRSAGVVRLTAALALLLLCLLPGWASAHARGQPTLLLETIVFHNETAARAHFGRICRYLEEQTGLHFKLVVAPDYLSASADLRRGDADLAYLSPLLSCWTQRWVPDVRYVATPRLTAEGSSYYHAVLISRDDSAAQLLEQVRGEALGLVNEESAAGYLFPLIRLMDLGIDPFDHFRKIYLLGTHQAVVEAVRQGSVAVGAAHERALGRDQQGLRILARSEPIPSSSLMASPFLAPAKFEAILAALLAPSYLEAVPGPEKSGRPSVYPDHGWQVLPDSMVDSPCRMASRLKEARKPR